MSMTTTLCIIVALLAAAFFAVRFFSKSDAPNDEEVMRLSRKDRAGTPPPPA